MDDDKQQLNIAGAFVNALVLFLCFYVFATTNNNNIA